jgi:prepilin-type N-terminal cleavage/methylation domain-containing protein/prepilin-type processing-associated H-X9-DG protein
MGNHQRSPRASRPSFAGFTLVELLVVITIIGILIALLLPAVQAAREAARIAQCKNNLKQIALGCLQHESAGGRFPSGGWGDRWAGDADRGTNRRQPGGWIYNILPYIDQQALHDLGAGLSPGPVKYAAHGQRHAVPLPCLYCPTRWSPRGLLLNATMAAAYPLYNADTPSLMAVTDYVANGGDTATFPSGFPIACNWSNPEFGPPDIAAGESPQTAQCFDAVGRAGDGIVAWGSLVRTSDVSDGTSCTYLAGEKFFSVLNPNYIALGPWDSALTGCMTHQIRYTTFPPLCDKDGAAGSHSSAPEFGGTHTLGCHMAFCDGSVRWINFSIVPEVHRRLGNRRDGLTIDAKSY